MSESNYVSHKFIKNYDELTAQNPHASPFIIFAIKKCNIYRCSGDLWHTGFLRANLYKHWAYRYTLFGRRAAE
ncbi:hypothetical protein PFDG_04482 [Plasmodium falciparum Dd2]|uniref:Uncharacterized protein n=1 Tax=Plasmodium falciparum (isolate Dd2) TaxID=57267 RepID=A0A0L7M644_PLAF4|nr:hypothetical protein PFDG_04482 [Plasmodium falciparum Dd2]